VPTLERHWLRSFEIWRTDLATRTGAAHVGTHDGTVDAGRPVSNRWLIDRFVEIHCQPAGLQAALLSQYDPVDGTTIFRDP
jgi:hypothetical protein